jgi:hypothetical protein
VRRWAKNYRNCRQAMTLVRRTIGIMIRTIPIVYIYDGTLWCIFSDEVAVFIGAVPGLNEWVLALSNDKPVHVV